MSIRFSIDEIIYDKITYKEKQYISLRVVPDSKSRYYSPFHVRYINIAPSLLDAKFLQKTGIESLNKIKGTGSVIQGGYYNIPCTRISAKELFNENTIIGETDDVFRDHIEPSPYDETIIKGKNVLFESKDIIDRLDDQRAKKYETYLYCFNVGQGDSFLLITSALNAYLIDTNIYNDRDLTRFSSRINSILCRHGMNPSEIKGLIVTHKHLDHIRGASQLISKKEFNIKYFIINMDYLHPTRCVRELYESAAEHIPTWINLNSPCRINEGETYICFKNPDDNTRDSNLAPDINNSSIAMCIRHGKNLFYLTGDAGCNILNEKLSCSQLCHRSAVLKVSHHGSSNGTSNELLEIIKPTKFAFISAGTSNRYMHPHRSTIDMLNNASIKPRISKNVRTTTCYKSDGYMIMPDFIIDI